MADFPLRSSPIVVIAGKPLIAEDRVSAITGYSNQKDMGKLIATL